MAKNRGPSTTGCSPSSKPPIFQEGLLLFVSVCPTTGVMIFGAGGRAAHDCPPLAGSRSPVLFNPYMSHCCWRCCCCCCSSSSSVQGHSWEMDGRSQDQMLGLTFVTCRLITAAEEVEKGVIGGRGVAVGRCPTKSPTQLQQPAIMTALSRNYDSSLPPTGPLFTNVGASQCQRERPTHLNGLLTGRYCLPALPPLA